MHKKRCNPGRDVIVSAGAPQGEAGINWREFENPNTPLSIMNLGVVIIYPRFKLKWADAADGKAECGALCIERELLELVCLIISRRC